MPAGPSCKYSMAAVSFSASILSLPESVAIGIVPRVEPAESGEIDWKWLLTCDELSLVLWGVLSFASELLGAVVDGTPVSVGNLVLQVPAGATVQTQLQRVVKADSSAV